ncbi:hypothetical protein TRAPUB_13632 [Trametes pubescens]|uniref:Uncharacterized protein n=1 Tax=Trametes pubescens TaxID=154538 RepID=A0A1M2VQK5_TRAPU|nr:hypothetical protein TRAPUB_13632 [Trametes pubescens]
MDGLPSRPSRDGLPTRLLSGLLPGPHSLPGKTSLSWATVDHRALGANGPILALLLSSGWSSADCAPDLSTSTPFFRLGTAREFLCDIPDNLQPDNVSSSNTELATGFLWAVWIFVFHAPVNVTLTLRLGQSVSDMSEPYEHTAHLLPTVRSQQPLPCQLAPERPISPVWVALGITHDLANA